MPQEPQDWQTVQVDDWQTVEESPKPERKGFFGAAWENLDPRPALKLGWETSPAGIAVSAYKAVRDRKLPAPPESVTAIANIPGESARQIGLAGGALAKGDLPKAAKHYAGAVPLIGPAAVQIGEDIERGEYPEAAGHAVGLVAPFAVGAIPKQIPIKLTPRLNAVQQAAVNFGERAGIPIDLATASGNEFFQGAKKLASKQPFSAGKAAALRGEQEAALASTGEKLAQIPGAGTGSKIVAGEGVQERLVKRLDALDVGADKAYKELRKYAAEPKNIHRIQTGMKDSSIIDPKTGNPVQVPVFENIAAPVARDSLQNVIRPIVESMEKTLPIADQQASPGLRALRQILDGPKVVDINTAIKDLSAIQNIARTDIPAMRDVSKGLAASAIPEYRAAIDRAAEAMGPQAKAALDRGRDFTRQKYEVFKLQKKLPKNPVQLVNRLTLKDDAAIDVLRATEKHAPAQMPDIGASVLEGILAEPTREGGFSRGASALRRWDKLGAETKKILFKDPQRIQDLDDFFMLAKMMGENPNPSGSATVGGILGASGIVLTSPLTGTTTLIAWKKLADLLMRPDGPALMRQGITMPLGEAMAPQVYSTILANATQRSLPAPPAGSLPAPPQ